MIFSPLSRPFNTTCADHPNLPDLLLLLLSVSCFGAYLFKRAIYNTHLPNRFSNLHLLRSGRRPCSHYLRRFSPRLCSQLNSDNLDSTSRQFDDCRALYAYVDFDVQSVEPGNRRVVPCAARWVFEIENKFLSKNACEWLISKLFHHREYKIHRRQFKLYPKTYFTFPPKITLLNLLIFRIRN